MSNALRRRLASLQNLTEDRGATAGEAAAAALAIARIADRLRAAGEAVEWPDLGEPCQDQQQQPGPVRRRARRKASHERPKQNRMKIGDLVDCNDSEGTFSRCRCGSSTMQVCPGIDGLAVATLYCPGCRRSRKLRREHFETGGRYI